MSPEKQRIAIAEACGWTYMGMVALVRGGDPRAWKPEEGLWVSQSDLPDYLADLNAMHEAEQYLTITEKARYLTHLTFYPDLGRLATAAQRAEAFLRTLGQWEP